MKLVLIIFGSWFVYWNARALNENLSAVWHVVGLIVGAVIVGLCLLDCLFEFLSGPPRRRRTDLDE